MINYLFALFLFNCLIYLNIDKIIKIYGLYDLPDNKRKLHLKKTSIVGGLLFLINILFYMIYILYKKDYYSFSLIFQNNLTLIYFFLVTLSFFVFGYLDDKYNINANLKLTILILLTFIILIVDDNLLILNLNLSFSETILSLNKFSFFFTVFCFIAFINAFNLFDGINCQIGFYILFILLIFNLYNLDIIFLCVLLFPLIVFLILNFKGKIFMGNAGSYFLGFTISYVIIKIYNNGNFLYADKILLIMLLPGIDMIRLFFIRIRNKKNPFSPDRNHLHHMLLKKYGYNRTILIIISLSILPYLTSVFIGSYIILTTFIILYSFLISFLTYKKTNN